MTTSTNVGIKNSWPLLDFARSHGRMKVTNELTNSRTGETFRSCTFVAPGSAVTLVGFSSNLGVLTPQQIAAQNAALEKAEIVMDNNNLWDADRSDDMADYLELCCEVDSLWNTCL